MSGNYVTCLRPGTVRVTMLVAETDIYKEGRFEITVQVLSGSGGGGGDEPGGEVIDGDEFTRDGIEYDIVTSVSGYQYARIIGVNDSSVYAITIPSQVAYKGSAFDVAVICDTAFINEKKLISVIIGENVQIIGVQAFKGCKKLKNIYVESLILKSVGKNALKGINKKCTIYVPSGMKSDYKKVFKGRGQKKSVKIKTF